MKQKMMKEEKAELGRKLFYGDSTLRTYKAAFPILLEAAEAGNVHCRNLVGFSYDRGFGTEKNPFLAFARYEKAAEEGSY